MLAPDGQGYRFNTPETRQAFHFLKSLVDEGCAWAGVNPPYGLEFASRKALTVAGSTAGLPAQKEAWDSVSNTDQWTAIPFPSPESRPVVYAYGPSLSIVKSNREQQLAAWLFLKWLVLPENQVRLARSSSALPVSISALDDLQEYTDEQPQWAAALELLPYARTEPGNASWRTVRLVLSDAGNQLFSATFPADAISDLIIQLEATAEEIRTQSR
jgi:multiple sugar transport system substrate-binding protein